METAGFVVIAFIYATVGVFAVIGSAVLTQRLLPVRWEQAFYALFLIAIAAFYLAFAAYFRASGAWITESVAVLIFGAIAVAGIRSVPLLVLGYLLHGAWDFLHELQAHGGTALAGDALTAIPLAYGIFCATFDVGIAVYALRRRSVWAGIISSGADAAPFPAAR
jgi:hypothetical protein